MSASLASLLARHPRRTVLGLVVFLAVAAAWGGTVADRLDSAHGFTPADSESARAVEHAQDAGGHEPVPGVTLLVRTPSGFDAPAQADRVRAAATALGEVDGVAEVVAPSPDDPRPAGLVAGDGSSALVLGYLDADSDHPAVAEAVLAAAARLGSADRSGSVEAGGPVVAELQIESTVTSDLTRAELFALPLLVLLSLLFFGGRAAMLPVLVGAATVLGTFVVIRLVDDVHPLSVFALNLVVGLGLGLAIDYTLFLLTRFRAELDRLGADDPMPAITATMATAGRTVVYSAATVTVAMASLTVFPMSFLRSMGIAGAVVAPVAALAALVVSPAVFGLWGARLGRRGGRRAERRWRRLALAVMRRPGLVAAATGVLMLVLSVPALRASWTPVDATVVPPGQSARAVAGTVTHDYPGRATVMVVLAGGADRGAEVTSYAAELDARPGVSLAGRPRPLGDSAWLLELSAPGDPASPGARRLVETVRTLPSTLDPLVAGPAAEFADQQAAIRAKLPLAAGVLIGLTLLALWLLTGSVLLPVKAVAMNLATVGVALGALTVVYQDGRFSGLLGYTPNGGVEPTTFLVAAAIVFALSTDYGVFLLDRIGEERRLGAVEGEGGSRSDRDAVAAGLAGTGSVVTAAAVLLAVAIGVFATSSISLIQQIGMATPVGVLVDAFVVRSLLVPSLMALFGAWNWWSPAWLALLHRGIAARSHPASGETGGHGADTPDADPRRGDAARPRGVPVVPVDLGR